MSSLIVGAQVRYRVLVGEDTDLARRGDKPIVAQSACSMRCPSSAVFEQTMEALFLSDERLKAQPEAGKFYDWQSVYFEPDAGVDGVGTLHFGVAWYDEAFFAEKASAYLSVMHRKMFGALGVPMGTLKVEHWRPVLAA
ncbi:hypothetical protein [Streptomyces jumonjinensis]|uniref:hypothetical protein n=1 Tax=Streptomyces jumonjinensis TaxID=1945 RepID=UPI0037B924F3